MHFFIFSFQKIMNQLVMATPPTCLSVRFSGIFLWAATQRRLGAYQICLGSWSKPAWFRTVLISSGVSRTLWSWHQKKLWAIENPSLSSRRWFLSMGKRGCPAKTFDINKVLQILDGEKRQTSIFGQWNQCEISNPCWFLRVSPWFLRLTAPRHSGAVTPIPSTRALELGQAAKSQDFWNVHCSKWLMVDDDWWCLMHLVSQDSNLIVGFVGQKSHFCSTKCHQTLSSFRVWLKTPGPRIQRVSWPAVISHIWIGS
jgi:hypothetical protein